MRSLTVLDFLYSVIVPCVDNPLVPDLRVLHAVNQGPAYSHPAGSRIDEALLRTCVQGILSIHKLRMKDNISLLGGGFDVRKSLPCLEVLGTDHSSRSHSR